MKTYPYIGQCKENLLTVIFYQRNSGTTLSCGQSDIAEVGKFETGFNEREFKNITADYLRNTYGKVESKEHAEFIAKLATQNGFKCSHKKFDETIACFYFFEDCLFFTRETISADREFKSITIPLPPKEPESKEWPQAGDEVLIDSKKRMCEFDGFNGENCEVIGISKHKGKKVLTLSHCSLGVTALIMGDWIKKPPTPEEELRDELIDITIKAMSDSNYDLTHNAYYLISGLMNKYDIKKKPL